MIGRVEGDKRGIHAIAHFYILLVRSSGSINYSDNALAAHQNLRVEGEPRGAFGIGNVTKLYTQRAVCVATVCMYSILFLTLSMWAFMRGSSADDGYFQKKSTKIHLLGIPFSTGHRGSNMGSTSPCA